MADNEKTPSADASDEDVAEEMKKLEEDPPDKLEDWPDGPAKYKTLGGGEGESGYDDGPTAKLGPSGLRYYEDGSVTIEGEKVDDPDEYKSDPIPGGPTDPNAPTDLGFDDDDDDGGDGDSTEARGDGDRDRDRDTEDEKSNA